MSEALDAFAQHWLERLQEGALIRFDHGRLPEVSGSPHAIADAYAVQLGLKPIVFNWELLDAAAASGEPRSALGEITQAMANRISNPAQSWLGEEMAARCARDLLEAFDPLMRTVVSNRYDGLWNPIGGASVEWGFVCFDDTHIALLLIAER